MGVTDNEFDKTARPARCVNMLGILRNMIGQSSLPTRRNDVTLHILQASASSLYGVRTRFILIANKPCAKKQGSLPCGQRSSRNSSLMSQLASQENHGRDLDVPVCNGSRKRISLCFGRWRMCLKGRVQVLCTSVMCGPSRRAFVPSFAARASCTCT